VARRSREHFFGMSCFPTEFFSARASLVPLPSGTQPQKWRRAGRERRSADPSGKVLRLRSAFGAALRLRLLPNPARCGPGDLRGGCALRLAHEFFNSLEERGATISRKILEPLQHLLRFVVRLLSSLLAILAEQIFHGNCQRFGELGELVGSNTHRFPFPVGDHALRYPQSQRELMLRQPRCLSRQCNAFSQCGTVLRSGTAFGHWGTILVWAENKRTC